MWRVKPIGLALLAALAGYVVGSLVIGIGGGDIIGLPRNVRAVLILVTVVVCGWRTWRKQAAKARPPEQRIPYRLYGGRGDKD